MPVHPVVSAHIVPGHPHVLLAPEKSPGWASLRRSYEAVANEIAKQDADVLLVYSTQWTSVIGHLFQADPNPKWLHVDPNWWDLGEMPYDFRVDAAFGHAYSRVGREAGLHTQTVNYRGFPVDTGTIVALKLLNPGNRLPAAVVSCNMYAEKQESVLLGQCATRALLAEKKRAVVVLVSSLSNRYEVTDLDPAHDRISSQKDDEWNRKVLELLGEGRLEDVSQVAREFAHQANADAKCKGIWWLAGVMGQHNRYRGRVWDYQPVWGTGAALVSLTPAATELATKESDDVADLALEGPLPERPAAPTRESTTAPAPAREAVPRAEAASTRESTGVVVTTAAPKPVGAYPHARRVGNMLFLSGVGPRSPIDNSIPGNVYGEDGKVVAYDVEAQTRAVIANVRAVLEAAGSSLEKIVDVTAYLTDMKRDFPAYNKVYAEVFAGIQATRTTLEVGALPTPIAVEFKVLATV